MSGYTEEEWDVIYKAKEELWDLVHDVVTHHLAGIDPVVADEVRQQMTEQFRFWRQQ